MASSSETPGTKRCRALEAAQWLHETQKAQLAEDPNRSRASIASARVAAQKFSVSKSSVARQLLALKNGHAHATTGQKPGRPTRFTDVDDQMLAFHLFMVRRAKQPVTPKVVRDAANALLSRKSPPGRPVSKSWVLRWLRKYRARAREEDAALGDGSRTEAQYMMAEFEMDYDEEEDSDYIDEGSDDGTEDGTEDDVDEDMPSEAESEDQESTGSVPEKAPVSPHRARSATPEKGKQVAVVSSAEAAEASTNTHSS